MSKRVLLGVVLIGFVSPLWAATQAVPAQTESVESGVVRSPTVEFEVKDFEFGEIYDDQPQTTLFKFKNTGDGTLVIRELQASCQCTASSING